MLGPGRWTSPVSASLMAQANRELVLAAGEQLVTQDFGWDADGQPVSTPVPATPIAEATPSPAGCTDLAGLVEDVSIPPGSSVAAGEAFRKVWRLRNDGTCTWAPDYAVVFSSGQAMGGTAAVSFGTSVLPGSTIDLALNLVAPTTPGTYRGYWLLRSSRGLLFGTPWSGVNPIWVEVVVTNAGTVGGWKAEYFANRRPARHAGVRTRRRRRHRLQLGERLPRSFAPDELLLCPLERNAHVRSGGLPLPSDHGRRRPAVGGRQAADRQLEDRDVARAHPGPRAGTRRTQPAPGVLRRSQPGVGSPVLGEGQPAVIPGLEGRILVEYKPLRQPGPRP